MIVKNIYLKNLFFISLISMMLPKQVFAFTINPTSGVAGTNFTFNEQLKAAPPAGVKVILQIARSDNGQFDSNDPNLNQLMSCNSSFSCTKQMPFNVTGNRSVRIILMDSTGKLRGSTEAKSLTVTPKVTPTNGTCGSVNGQSVSSTPNYNLCSSGTATSVTGYGPWSWNCSGANGGSSISCSAKKTVPATNGTCGSVNGTTVSSTPSSNLCSSGSGTSVTGSGPWNWNCNGANGGTNASCSANKKTTIPIPTIGDLGISPSGGVAGTTFKFSVQINGSLTGRQVVLQVGRADNGQFDPQDTNLNQNVSCSNGSCSKDLPFSVSGNRTVRMIVKEGSNVIATGTTKQLSVTAKVSSTNGTCGSVNGTTASSTPSSNLCSSGNATAVTGTGPWKWNCNGANGGTNASCSANKTGTLTPTIGDLSISPSGGVAGTTFKFSVQINGSLTGRQVVLQVGRADNGQFDPQDTNLNQNVSCSNGSCSKDLPFSVSGNRTVRMIVKEGSNVIATGTTKQLSVTAKVSATNGTVNPTADTTKPTISGFSVSPATVTQGGSVTISYTAADSGSGLDHVELFYSTDNRTWKSTGKKNSHSGKGPINGSFTDTPSGTGTHYYGVTPYDKKGNKGESGSKQVTVNPPTIKNDVQWREYFEERLKNIGFETVMSKYLANCFGSFLESLDDEAIKSFMPDAAKRMRGGAYLFVQKFGGELQFKFSKADFKNLGKDVLVGELVNMFKEYTIKQMGFDQFAPLPRELAKLFYGVAVDTLKDTVMFFISNTGASYAVVVETAKVNLLFNLITATYNQSVKAVEAYNGLDKDLCKLIKSNYMSIMLSAKTLATASPKDAALYARKKSDEDNKLKNQSVYLISLRNFNELPNLDSLMIILRDAVVLRLKGDRNGAGRLFTQARDKAQLLDSNANLLQKARSNASDIYYNYSEYCQGIKDLYDKAFPM